MSYGYAKFFTYKIPTFMSVTQIRIIGKVLLLDVWFVVRPTWYLGEVKSSPMSTPIIRMLLGGFRSRYMC